jgi:hypothetical protein
MSTSLSKKRFQLFILFSEREQSKDGNIKVDFFLLLLTDAFSDPNQITNFLFFQLKARNEKRYFSFKIFHSN